MNRAKVLLVMCVSYFSFLLSLSLAHRSVQVCGISFVVVVVNRMLPLLLPSIYMVSWQLDFTFTKFMYRKLVDRSCLCVCIS